MTAPRLLIATPLIALTVLDVAAIAQYVVDSAELRKQAFALTEGATTATEKLERIVERVSFELPPGHPDVYFLAPVFRFMKPTALQVLTHGGDCAYKARASIVLLDKLDIDASKLVLHDPKTKKPVHAVAMVDTERGEYVVDLLFGVIYRDAEGAPIPLEALNANPELANEVLDREAAAGNPLVAGYPRDRYVYGYTRSINWHKHGLSIALHGVLSAIFGQEAIDDLQRPYLSEEPALMVLIASSGAKLGWLVGVGVAWWYHRRRNAGDRGPQGAA